MAPKARRAGQRASPNRRGVAPLLGVHRHTSGHWLARYEAGGLDAVLDLDVPAGNPLSRPSDVLAARAQALRQPPGVASYAASRQRGKPTHHLDVTSHTRYPIIRTKGAATRKVPRLSHT
jgi:hypothetical protein